MYEYVIIYIYILCNFSVPYSSHVESENGPWLVWIEHWPVNQRVTGSIPSLDTFLDCGPGSQWGGV